MPPRKTIVAVALLVVLMVALFWPKASYYDMGPSGADLDRPGATYNAAAAGPMAANSLSYDVSAAGLIPRGGDGHGGFG
jgi:hypothetical protein